MNGGNVPQLSASLYAGDLSLEVTEPMLLKIFGAYGPISSIRVCRDAVTRRSLGYAYINFHNMADAERALDTLNYSPILGKPCRIMWKHRDPSLRRSGTNNVFIKNLDKSIDNRQLHDTFSAFGNIVSCKVAMDESGASKGYGFVQFEKLEEANSAIEKVNDMFINGKKVSVTNFIPRAEREKGSPQKFTNLYIKNLSLEITTEQLKEFFSKYGEVVSAVVMTDESGASRGFGFVNFEDSEVAEKVLEEMSKKEDEEGNSEEGVATLGKEVIIAKAEKKAKRQAELRAKWEQRRLDQQAKWRGVNLYIKNLDESVDDDQLRQRFAEFGTITSARVMKDEKAQSKGFGFVCYSSPDEATRAITAMNNAILANKPLYVALHQPREVRRAHLEAQYGAMRGAPLAPGMPPSGAPFLYAPQGMQQAAGRQPQMLFYNPQVMQLPRGQQFPGPQGPMPGQMGPGQRGPRNYRGRGGHGGRKGGRRDQPAEPVEEGQLMGEMPITEESLAGMPIDDQKEVLGNKLYSKISEIDAERAGKITGMLLDLEVSDLINLVSNDEELRKQAGEAIAALEQAANEAPVEA